ncbi:MAG: hypothetical protein K5650_00760 [Bacteroidales bacterium]|nr:hypothetical protein [Bacteroidales bacterium]
MPMFYTPKPRQFHYQPRFYDPEKERWEALKQRYADRQKAEEARDAAETQTVETPADDELRYFEDKVRRMNREEREKQSRFGVKDLFRKRPMPTFNYTPRFQQGEGQPAQATIETAQRKVKIKRRFDIADDDYMKPMPAGRIMLYALLVCALLYWILF